MAKLQIIRKMYHLFTEIIVVLALLQGLFVAGLTTRRGRTQEALARVASCGVIKKTSEKPLDTPWKYHRRRRQDFYNPLFSATGILIYS